MPAALLLGACLFGMPWSVLAILAITVLVFFMDRLVSLVLPEDAGGDGTRVSLALAAAHFTVWPAAIWAVAGGSGLLLPDRVLIVIGAGLFFGQISNSNAHELIHSGNRWLRRLGVALYASLLFGHHSSTHLRVHHVHAATARDPNTARGGEGFWRFMLRAWRQGFIAGKQAEDALRGGAAGLPAGLAHPYTGYVLSAAAVVVVAGILGGPTGILALVAIASYAQLQLFLSDYVQHYGLQRRVLADGKPEPIGPQHSWNAPHWYSSAMMLNAPRHSDHHMHPGRSFPALELDADQMPMLPHSLPVMAVLALVPPLWRRIMDPRVGAWRGRDAAAAPRASDIPRAVLDKARSGGVPRPDLPVSPHDTPVPGPAPGPAVRAGNGRTGRNPDERRRV